MQDGEKSNQVETMSLNVFNFFQPRDGLAFQIVYTLFKLIHIIHFF